MLYLNNLFICSDVMFCIGSRHIGLWCYASLSQYQIFRYLKTWLCNLLHMIGLAYIFLVIDFLHHSASSIYLQSYYHVCHSGIPGSTDSLFQCRMQVRLAQLRDSTECVLDSPGGESGWERGWTRATQPLLGAYSFATWPCLRADRPKWKKMPI